MEREGGRLPANTLFPIQFRLDDRTPVETRYPVNQPLIECWLKSIVAYGVVPYAMVVDG